MMLSIRGEVFVALSLRKQNVVRERIPKLFATSKIDSIELHIDKIVVLMIYWIDFRYLFFCNVCPAIELERILSVARTQRRWKNRPNFFAGNFAPRTGEAPCACPGLFGRFVSKISSVINHILSKSCYYLSLEHHGTVFFIFLLSYQIESNYS